MPFLLDMPFLFNMTFLLETKGLVPSAFQIRQRNRQDNEPHVMPTAAPAQPDTAIPISNSPVSPAHGR